MSYHTLEAQGDRHRWVIEIANSQESIEAMRADGIDIQEVIKVIEVSDEELAGIVARKVISEAKG